jgi:tRNA modification GTPase
VVLNNIDQPGGAPGPLPAGVTVVRISALTGAGLDELRGVIAQLADSFQSDTGSELIAINARHAHALGLAQESLAEAHAKLKAGKPTELVASDLRSALVAFGEIAGRIDNEKILDQLFASFCIGK